MSDIFDRYNIPTGDDDILERYSVPDSTSGNQELFSDPSFRQLIDAQRQLQEAIASPAAGSGPFPQSATDQYANLVEDLTDELTTKYGISARELGRYVVDPEFDSFVGKETLQATGDMIGRAALTGVDVLEPFIEAPQQVFFRALSAQLESARQGDNFVETVRNIAESPKDVEWGKIFGPGLQENAIRYGDILEQVGVNNRTAIRVFGLAGDIFADPLLAGSYARGLGTIARGVGATKAAKKLTAVGTGLERALSPAGVARGARGVSRAVAPAASAATDRRVASFVNGILNTPVPYIRGSHLGIFPSPRGQKSVGEFIFARGQNPVMPDRSVFEGGAGVPEEFLKFRDVAELEADDFLDFVNGNMDEVRAVLGDERFSSVMRGGKDALKRRDVAYARARTFPTELRDTIENLATETSDNVSPLFSDEVMDTLSTVRTRGAEGVIAPTVGEELSSIRGAFGERSSVIIDRNVTRVREVAERIGRDPNEAEEAFRFVTNKLVESDALLGWHSSLYVPMKERFFEEVMRLGGNADDAGRLWQEAVRSGGMGDSLSQFRGVVNADEAQSVFAASREAGEDAPDLRRALGYIFDEMGTTQLDIQDWFRGLNTGHLRRTYAINMEDWQAYTTSLRAGTTAPNRLLETALDEGIEGVTPEVQGLVREYLETVSPTIPGERGFLVSQDRLARFLLERGVPRGEAQDTLIRMVRSINTDGSVDDIALRLQDWKDRQAGPAASRSTGPSTGQSFTAERTLGYTDQQRAAFAKYGLEVPEELPRTERGLLDVEGLPEGVRTATDPVSGERLFEPGMVPPDARTLSEMGRLMQANIPVAESGLAAATKYPTQKFIADIRRWAQEKDLLFRPSDVNRPHNFRVLEGDAYGSLSGFAVHPWIKKEIDNAIRVPGDRTRAAARVRGAIMGSWLANPSTTFVNLQGGIMSAAFAGENPVEFTADLARIFADAQKAGGLQNLPEYREVADLMRSGVLRSQFVRGLATDRLEAVATNRSWVEQIGMLAESYNDLMMRPGRLVGTPGTAIKNLPIPGARAAGEAIESVGERVGKYSGAFGLEAFQATEDGMKLAMYRRAINRGEDAVSAYKAARNVVFDYSALPESIALLRDTGLVLFPGFTTFMTGRLFNAVANRPGVVGAYGRLGDAIWNAVIPEEGVRDAAWASMDEYQREDKYVPVRQKGDRFSLMPLNQIFPVAPWAGNPLMESLTSLGIYQGAYDVMRSFANQGRAEIGQQFGQRVFEPQVQGEPEMYQQIAEFMVNSYGPSNLRKAFQFPAGTGEARGWVPELSKLIERNVFSGDDQAARAVFDSIGEMQAGRPNRDLFESVLSATLRSTQPVSLDPTLNRVIAGRSSQNFQDQEVITALTRELSGLYLNPDVTPDERQRETERILMEKMDITMEQVDRVMTVLRGMAQLRRLQNQGTPGGASR